MYLASGASGSLIELNTINGNGGHGIRANGLDVVGNQWTKNLVYDNLRRRHRQHQRGQQWHPRADDCAGRQKVTITTQPGAMVEIYSDDGGQGRFFEARIKATNGTITLTRSWKGAQVNATATDADGNSSGFAFNRAMSGRVKPGLSAADQALKRSARCHAHMPFSLRQHGTCHCICVSFLRSTSAKTKHIKEITYHSAEGEITHRVSLCHERKQRITMYALILAGGSGTRLWPHSRSAQPKQFLPINGERTMLQETFDRTLPIIPPERVYVATGPAYADLVMAQLPDVPRENILIEPAGHGTAPCIGLAALHLRRRDPEAVMAVLSADHRIEDAAGFRAALGIGELLAQQGHLVTMGIQPTAPSTGYGYIQRGQRLYQEGEYTRI